MDPTLEDIALESAGRFTVPRIHILPAEVTSRIAAGEVIERPASVVKELVENAIDAGAKRIHVDLSGGGMRLIRVADDGCGIARDDLGVAIQPHATSKIREAEEIVSLSTLGFRGEALPSIAAVSRFTLTSRAANSPDGAWRITQEGGLPRVPEPQPAGAPCGTSVEVRELFFNLPARQKFLKGGGSEAGACTEVVLRLALSRPDIGFALYQDSHEIIDLPPCARPAVSVSAADKQKKDGHAAPALPAALFLERARAVLGAHNSKGLFEVDSAQGSEDPAHFHGYRLFGLLSPPAMSRPNRAHIFLNINGRPVKDRTLTSALLEAYRHLLPPRRYPLGVLFLELPPADVDINVHPTKAEVRFRAPGLVYALLHHAVRLATTANSEFGVRNSESSGTPQTANSEFGIRNSELNAAPPVVKSRELDVPSAPELLALRSDPLKPAAPQQRHLDLWPRSSSAPSIPYAASSAPSASIAAEAKPRVAFNPEYRIPNSELPSPSPSLSPAPFAIHNPQSAIACAPRVIGQAGAAYIIIEDASGLKIVDQHALHERILFEGLLQRAQANARADSQGLLVPEPFELTAVQAAVFREDAAAQETLAAIGFSMELQAPRTLLIKSIPAVLTSARHKPARAVADVLDAIAACSDDLSEKKPLTRAYYREKAAYILSCKGAIKAGERLTHEQMSALIADFHRIVGYSGFTCPHGRPLALDVTWSQIERAVGR